MNVATELLEAVKFTVGDRTFHAPDYRKLAPDLTTPARVGMGQLYEAVGHEFR